MAWTSLSFPFGSVLPSAKLTQLYNNFAAMAAGNAGAPTIVAAALDTPCIDAARIYDANVTYVKLRTDGTQVTGTIDPESTVEITTNGGITAYPNVSTNDTVYLCNGSNAGLGDATNPRIGLYNPDSVGSRSYNVKYRRIY